MTPNERGVLKAFVILQKENLLTNTEKAARSLGVYAVASVNSNDRLWEIAHSEDEPTGSAIVGSEPIVEIATKDPEGGQKPGVRPTVVSTKAVGR